MKEQFGSASHAFSRCYLTSKSIRTSSQGLADAVISGSARRGPLCFVLCSALS